MPRQLTARKTSHQKWIHIFFSLYCDYSNSLTLLNASELFWGRISKEKENFVTHCLFTSFTKRESRYFHVVQWRQRNVQQSVMTVQSCCFACQSSYCRFLFLVRRRRILNFLLFAIHCDPLETEFCQCILNCSCWQPPKRFSTHR